MFPDLDAISSVWLLKKFDSEFENAEVKFVPAGTTYQNKVVDSDPDVVHVDTGLGRFDHHQSEDRICAAELVFNYLKFAMMKYRILINSITTIDFLRHYCLTGYKVEDFSV